MTSRFKRFQVLSGALRLFRLTPLSLYLFQLIAHCALGYWLISLTFNLQNFLVPLAVYVVTGLGMTVCYHRLLTHRSFTTHKWIERTMTLLTTIGLTGSSLSWTAAHRLHHRKADREGDPHSPYIMGFATAQWGSMFSPISLRSSPVFGSRFHRMVHKFYLPINLGYGLLLYLLGGVWAVVHMWLVPAAILWNAGSLINTICHTPSLGYRYREGSGVVPPNRDLSVNNPVLGVLVFGEGHHNNHHQFPGHARIGLRWWEIDIGYMLIKLIRTDKKARNV